MNFLKTLTTAALFFASLSSSAAIIEVSYEGVVNSQYGDGAGYNINDVISGSLFIDTSLVTDYYSQANRGYYHSYYNNNADYITGFDHDTAVDQNIDSDITNHDYFYLEDEYYQNDRDYFYIRDYEHSNYNDNVGNYGYTNSYVGFGAESYVDDFISGDSLIQSFTLTDFSSFANTWGTVYSQEGDYKNNQQTNYHYGYSHFTLTRLSYNTVKDVPEPSSIAILALGLFGLLARKRAIK